MLKALLLLVCFVIFSVETTKLPSNLEKCDRKTPDFEKCLTRAIQNAFHQFKYGSKELNMPKNEPFDIGDIKIGAGQRTVHVDQIFKNAKLYGLSETKVQDFKFDLNTLTMVMDLLIPLCSLRGDYELNGNLLVFPVQGQGKSVVDLVNLRAVLTLKLKIVERKGEQYYKVDNSNIELTPEKMIFKFDNLFNGNKLLGDNINQVLNDNWKAVFDDIKSGYEQVFANIGETLGNRVFSKVPIVDLIGSEK